MSCWFLNKPRRFILPGRFGDIIQCLPAFHEIFWQTGQRPIVIVSEEYASVFDGVGYVEPVVVPFHWSEGIPKMRALYKDATVVQWWNTDDPVPPEYRGNASLTCRGKTWRIDIKRWPSYGHSMMERLGFPDVNIWRDMPMVFTQRDYDREDRLIPKHSKPLLIYNFTGISSPFGYLDAMWPILQELRKDFHLVDLGKIKAHRIYDLLGLYDAAVGLLTCDTATLHLAMASTVPYLAWTQNGWLGSVPRGNCVLQIPYNQTLRRLPEVRNVLESWKSERFTPKSLLVHQG